VRGEYSTVARERSTASHHGGDHARRRARGAHQQQIMTPVRPLPPLRGKRVKFYEKAEAGRRRRARGKGGWVDVIAANCKRRGRVEEDSDSRGGRVPRQRGGGSGSGGGYLQWMAAMLSGCWFSHRAMLPQQEEQAHFTWQSFKAGFPGCSTGF
jgi:hypothetical protein